MFKSVPTYYIYQPRNQVSKLSTYRLVGTIIFIDIIVLIITLSKHEIQVHGYFGRPRTTDNTKPEKTTLVYRSVR